VRRRANLLARSFTSFLSGIFSIRRSLILCLMNVGATQFFTLTPALTRYGNERFSIIHALRYTQPSLFWDTLR